jgi:hypothetical protein
MAHSIERLLDSKHQAVYFVLVHKTPLNCLKGLMVILLVDT